MALIVVMLTTNGLQMQLIAKDNLKNDQRLWQLIKKTTDREGASPPLTGWTYLL